MSIFRFKKRWQSQGQGGYYYAALASVEMQKDTLIYPRKLMLMESHVQLRKLAKTHFEAVYMLLLFFVLIL